MSEQQQLVGYYQQKIDELYRQRLAWLSRFQQCATQLAEKQQLMQTVKTHRDRQGDMRRHIYHHDIALLDENINVVKMQRESIFNEYEDAQQILKMEELMEEFPQQIEKHLPCAVISNNAETIQNQLNIHSANNRSKIPAGKPNASIFREQNSVLSQKDKQKQSKLKYKPTYQELMRRQAAELKTNQEREAVLLQEQLAKLEKTIQEAKRQEASDLDGQREAVAQLQKEQQRQQQRHKQLAQKYFQARKQGKNQREAALAEQAKLKETLQQLQARVAEETRHYQKQNKARQTLILRKSEDFQQDYKARMRAKEHNLQALRDNYEKMQEVCIERVQKLEQALTGAKRKLEETERRREETTAQLRAELSDLERKEKEQRVEKARVDQQAREKVQAQKRKREELQERAVKQEQRHKKAQLIEEAYRKGSAGSAKKKQRPSKASKQYADPSGSEQESSMDISQLQNIKEHINKLDHIIRPKKSK